MIKKAAFISLGLMGLLIQTPAFAGPRSAEIKQAVEYLSACGNFIRYDDENVLTGFGPEWTGPEVPRRPRPSILRFVPIGRLTEYQVSTLDSAFDALKVGEWTYVLTPSGLEEWILRRFERLAVYPTHRLSRPLKNGERPRALARYQDQILIAHGTLGVSIFDLKSKTVVRTLEIARSHRPLESVVNGIAVSGTKAYAVLDSHSLVEARQKPAFRGIAVIDLPSGRVVSEADGLAPGADSIVADGTVAIVSFYGQPLWKFSLVSTLSKAMPEPLKRVWKFPFDGHPTGHPSIDDQYYYTCFTRLPKENEGIFPTRGPMVLDRRVLMLDGI